jgi:A/G-specific adenine glycosylase
MLQQTQVERVIDKYNAFITRFPDFRTLSRASLRSVLKAWQGLGYNRRAVALHTLAKEVVKNMEGQLPSSPDILETLPGIGKATAASICAFAFNKPVVFIETNIRRVFIHFFFHDKTNVSDKEILPLVEKSLVPSNAGQWYSALMDYGSMMKKSIPNPNIKSRHYSRQSPFEGSNRQLRGKIIRFITKAGTLTAARLIEQTEADPEKVRTVLKKLQKEGFMQKIGRGFTI